MKVVNTCAQKNANHNSNLKECQITINLRFQIFEGTMKLVHLIFNLVCYIRFTLFVFDYVETGWQTDRQTKWQKTKPETEFTCRRDLRIDRIQYDKVRSQINCTNNILKKIESLKQTYLMLFIFSDCLN